MNSKTTDNRLARNRTGEKKYRTVECFEAGIKLTGSEVKSIKAGQATIDGSYVVVRGGEAFAVGVNVPAWQPNNLSRNRGSSHEVERPKKLILKSRELEELLSYDGRKGFAISLLSLYNKNGLIKAHICVATNKSNRDKRQEIKKRDTERDLRRNVKYR